MDTFQIWPTEALIIGRFAEEWLEARRECPMLIFAPFFANRVGHFVPDMTVDSCASLSEGDFPGDVNWADGPGWRRGTSPSVPGVEFVDERGKLLAFRVGHHRKSLIALVFGLLGPYIARANLVENPFKIDGEDRPDDILAHLAGLASESGVIPEFKIGRALGTIAASAQRLLAAAGAVGHRFGQIGAIGPDTLGCAE